MANRSSLRLKCTNNNVGGGTKEDEKLIKFEDTIARNSDETDISMINIEDTIIENSEDSPLEFAEGIGITSTQHNKKENGKKATDEETKKLKAENKKMKLDIQKKDREIERLQKQVEEIIEAAVKTEEELKIIKETEELMIEKKVEKKEN